MSDISFHFEGLFFAAAGVGTVVLSILLLIGASAFTWMRARSEQRRITPYETSRYAGATLVCLGIGIATIALSFAGGHGESGWAFRGALDEHPYAPPVVGLVGWAITWTLLSPSRAEKKKKAKTKR